MKKGHLQWKSLQDLILEIDKSLGLLNVKIKQFEHQRKPKKFSPNMLINEALQLHEEAASVFSTYHLPNCSMCVVRFEETLAEAAQAYDLPLIEWLEDLNHLLTID